MRGVQGVVRRGEQGEEEEWEQMTEILEYGKINGEL